MIFVTILCLAWVPVSCYSMSIDDHHTEVVDLQGTLQTPLAQPNQRGIVLFFVMSDCPISNAYAPEINRIRKEYTDRQIASFVIYVDPKCDETRIRTHAAEHKIDGSILIDREHQLADRLQVTIAPQAMLLTPDGKTLYRGRIDDLYANYGKRRAQASEHYLKNALDAWLADQSIALETTPPIGCRVVLNRPDSPTNPTK